MKNTTIIWDLDNTTWNHDKNIVTGVAQHFNIKCHDGFMEQFLDALHASNIAFRTRMASEDLIHTIMEEKIPELFFNKISGKEFFRTYLYMDVPTLVPNAKEVISQLYERGKRQCVLTDWMKDIQLKHLRDNDLLKYFEQIITFEDTGFAKGNPKIDEKVVFSKDSIIIGDSLHNDIAFANRNGIDSIWFNPNMEKNNTSWRPTYEIRDLLDVLEIVK